MLTPVELELDAALELAGTRTPVVLMGQAEDMFRAPWMKGRKAAGVSDDELQTAR